MSGDTTMAALSARSIAAVLRARRNRVLDWCRDQGAEHDPRDETALIDYQALPDQLRCYNPHRFLYPPSETTQGSASDRVRTYVIQDEDLWSAGAYVPVVFATPMNTLISRGNEESEGPWRITIAIYKSRGMSPADQVDWTATDDDIPLIPWTDRSGKGYGEPGDFILDWNPTSSDKSFRGEAYKVSRVYPGRNPELPSDDSVFPVAALQRPEDDASDAFVADRMVKTSGGGDGDVPAWMSLRGAIAVYHTILGD
jgi:hypothetical protein